MQYIDFGYGYRLHRRDSANWELQEFRKPSNKGFAKNMEDKSPKWCDCGKFFQTIRSSQSSSAGKSSMFSIIADCSIPTGRAVRTNAN